MEKNKKNNKKNKCKPVIISVIVIVIDIILGISIYTFTKDFTLAKCVFKVFLMLYFVALITILIVQVWENWKEWALRALCIIAFFLIVFFVPFGIHYLMFKDNQIDENTWISFYGSFIAFAGELGLGLFLYFRDVWRVKEERIKKARFLYDYMMEVSHVFLRFDSFLKRGERIRAFESWRVYYFEISHLIEYDERDFKCELDRVFKCVDRINNAIDQNDTALARAVYDDFIQFEQYRSGSYNYMEITQILLDISIGLKQPKPWLYLCENEIDDYADAFFDIVNMWIYNYMIRNDINTCDLADIELLITDWLLEQDDIRKWIEHPFEKRKVSRMVFAISLKIRTESKLLDFCWGAYSLRK